jgi:hypothetical protein
MIMKRYAHTAKSNSPVIRGHQDAVGQPCLTDYHQVGKDSVDWLLLLLQLQVVTPRMYVFSLAPNGHGAITCSLNNTQILHVTYDMRRAYVRNALYRMSPTFSFCPFPETTIEVQKKRSRLISRGPIKLWQSNHLVPRPRSVQFQQ